MRTKVSGLTYESHTGLYRLMRSLHEPYLSSKRTISHHISHIDDQLLQIQRFQSNTRDEVQNSNSRTYAWLTPAHNQICHRASQVVGKTRRTVLCVPGWCLDIVRARGGPEVKVVKSKEYFHLSRAVPHIYRRCLQNLQLSSY